VEKQASTVNKTAIAAGPGLFLDKLKYAFLIGITIIFSGLLFEFKLNKVSSELIIKLNSMLLLFSLILIIGAY
jgi:hypothetical protein